MAVTQQFNWSSVSNVGSVGLTVTPTKSNFLTGANFDAKTTTSSQAVTDVTVTATVSGGSSSSYNITHKHYDDEYLAILTTLNNHLVELVSITNDMKADIQRLRERGETNSLGICTSTVVDENSLKRAVVVDGLKKANLIEEVRAEMRNPTPMPQ